MNVVKSLQNMHDIYKFPVYCKWRNRFLLDNIPIKINIKLKSIYFSIINTKICWKCITKAVGVVFEKVFNEFVYRHFVNPWWVIGLPDYNFNYMHVHPERLDVVSDTGIHFRKMILSGKELSAEIRNNLADKIKKFRINNPGFKPSLSIVQVKNFLTEGFLCFQKY